MSPAEKMASKKPKKNEGPARNVVLICRMRKKRQELGLTLRDVEKATKVNNVTILDAERGCGITLQNALRLARFFGVAVEDLWSEVKS